MEIDNRHWDGKRDEAGLLSRVARFTDPKQLADQDKALKLYPDELFEFQGDYPKRYLNVRDAGTKKKRLTGVAANDSVRVGQVVSGRRRGGGPTSAPAP